MTRVLVFAQGVDKEKLVEDVARSLYAAKVCSYAQGMNIIKAKSAAMGWDIDLGALARIWKVRPLGSACTPSGLCYLVAGSHLFGTLVLLQDYRIPVRSHTLRWKRLLRSHASGKNSRANGMLFHLQGGCIIRASFLDEIKQAYERNPALENLLMDEYFAKKIAESQTSWRSVVKQAIDAGECLATP